MDTRRGKNTLKNTVLHQEEEKMTLMSKKALTPGWVGGFKSRPKFEGKKKNQGEKIYDRRRPST